MSGCRRLACLECPLGGMTPRGDAAALGLYGSTARPCVGEMLADVGGQPAAMTNITQEGFWSPILRTRK